MRVQGKAANPIKRLFECSRAVVASAQSGSNSGPSGPPNFASSTSEKVVRRAASLASLLLALSAKTSAQDGQPNAEFAVFVLFLLAAVVLALIGPIVAGPARSFIKHRRQAMAEVLLEYRVQLRSDDGRPYVARAFGSKAHDGTNRWQGWIEFLPAGGGCPIRTGCETTQPNRACRAWDTAQK